MCIFEFKLQIVERLFTLFLRVDDYVSKHLNRSKYVELIFLASIGYLESTVLDILRLSERIRVVLVCSPPNCGFNYTVNLCTFLDWCNSPNLPLIVIVTSSFQVFLGVHVVFQMIKWILFSSKLSINMGLSNRLWSLNAEKTFWI